jgi:hypothetical protein
MDKTSVVIFTEALKIAKDQIIALHPNGDPRSQVDWAAKDPVQVTVLNIIDVAIEHGKAVSS